MTGVGSVFDSGDKRHPVEHERLHAFLPVGATFDCRTYIGKIESGLLVTSSYIALGMTNIHHAFLPVGATFDCRTYIGKIESHIQLHRTQF